MIDKLLDFPLVEWAIYILATIAGIAAAKFLVAYLPDSGILGAGKNIVLSV